MFHTQRCCQNTKILTQTAAASKDQVWERRCRGVQCKLDGLTVHHTGRSQPLYRLALKCANSKESNQQGFTKHVLNVVVFSPVGQVFHTERTNSRELRAADDSFINIHEFQKFDTAQRNVLNVTLRSLSLVLWKCRSPAYSARHSSLLWDLVGGGGMLLLSFPLSISSSYPIKLRFRARSTSFLIIEGKGKGSMSFPYELIL